MSIENMTCSRCGSVLSAVTFTCVRGSFCKPAALATVPLTETRDLERLEAALLHAITELDRAEERREVKRGVRVNLHRIGIYLSAKQSMLEDVHARIAKGVAVRDAFRACLIEHFCPTREFHRFTKRVGLPLDVQRGRWINTETGRAYY